MMMSWTNPMQKHNLFSVQTALYKNCLLYKFTSVLMAWDLKFVNALDMKRCLELCAYKKCPHIAKIPSLQFYYPKIILKNDFLFNSTWLKMKWKVCNIFNDDKQSLNFQISVAIFNLSFKKKKELSYYDSNI